MSLYIDKQWIKGEGEVFESYNPATNDVVWQGHFATAEQVDSAVLAARKATVAWAAKTFEEREAILESFIKILEKEKQTFAEIISKEMGKPLWEALTEVSGMIAKLAVSMKALGERTPDKQQDISGGQMLTCFKPQGVIAVLGPFNFPGHLPNGQIIPALLAGNTIVFKPSELTPLVAEKMMQCWDASDLPAGVVNLVQGGADVGKLLSQHTDLNGLFFTGSYATGRALHQQFAGYPEKILVLEMGGNNPLIVSKINNMNAAVYHTIQSAFITSGQRCTCARRLIVLNNQEGDDFIDALVKATKRIKVGAYTDSPEPFMGPLISKQAAQHVLERQVARLAQGATSLLEIKILKDNSAFVSPGIIDVTKVDQLDEECFGPLLEVFRVSSFDEAISVANDTTYGLSAGLLSDDERFFQQFHREIKAGIVNWNKPITGASGAVPFGGVGHSGNHRPGAYFTVDHCAYPCVSTQTPKLELPEALMPGYTLKEE